MEDRYRSSKMDGARCLPAPCAPFASVLYLVPLLAAQLLFLSQSKSCQPKTEWMDSIISPALPQKSLQQLSSFPEIIVALTHLKTNAQRNKTASQIMCAGRFMCAGSVCEGSGSVSVDYVCVKKANITVQCTLIVSMKNGVWYGIRSYNMLRAVKHQWAA